MISIAKPLIDEAERSAVMAVLESGQIAQGPKVREFEAKFAEWVGAKHAVATTSGTSALHVALLAHGIGPGDEVITSPFSFIASANCALFVGARPTFADIEQHFYTINPEAISEAISPRTKAIIPVHLFGLPCDMESIAEIARKHNLIIIEDACQAHGAKLNGLPMGSWGTACYSFYPTKNMTTIEGGMVTTNDAAIAEKARLIRDHGSPRRYEHVMLGYNLRMTDVQAAIGLVQLDKIETWTKTRQANAAYLTRSLSGLSYVEVPVTRSGATHVYHQYTIRIKDRDKAIQELSKAGIGFGIYYPIPIHQQPLYRDLGYDLNLPIAETASQNVLSLPVHPSLSPEDLNHILTTIANL